MPLLALHFLGSPRVVLDGETIELDRRKVLALLAYLAVTARRHSRDELAELLYGEQDAAHARANLRRTLSLLRGTIGEDRVGADRHGVWLPEDQDLWLDVQALRDLLEDGRRADTRSDLTGASDSLAAAARLYRGEFLAGFYLSDSTAFDDWQLLQQEGLRSQMASALQRLVEIHGVPARYDQAIDYGRQLLSLDRLEEAAHRQLMRLLALAGRPQEALRQYDRCRSALTHELGVQPDEETDRLRELIVSGKPMPGAKGQQVRDSPDGCPTNLRAQPTPFIGREDELAAVRGALQSPGIRLLTLTGAGGTGKTRLAVQAAAGLLGRFEKGVYIVDLAPLREPDAVIGTLAAALNVREVGDGEPILETLKTYLGAKRVLLVLDSFEHLLPAAGHVADLLASCPQLKVLATSRETLRVRAERVLVVHPMQLPSQGQSLTDLQCSEAVRLFVDRAAATRATFELSDENAPLVAQICVRLDGLPLAIELAATRIGALTLETLLSELQDRLDLLKGGPRDLPERQRALRSEIDWSHELLEPEERRLFRRLSVFPAGCTAEAASTVCRMAGEDLDVLAILSSLAEKSLLQSVEGSGVARFRMLGTIREYAREQLEESGELDTIEPQFAAHCLCFVEEAESELYGPDQMRWFLRIEEEYGNLREGLAWLYDRRELVDGLRLAGALGWFWFRRARFAEGEHWLGLYRAAAHEVGPPGLRAKAAYALGWMRLCGGSRPWGNPAGAGLFEESLEMWREAGHQRGAALSQIWLAWTGADEGRTSWELADESVKIARGTGDAWTISWCLKLAYSYLRRPDKDLESKRAALEEAIALARTTGDPFLLSQALHGMGSVFSWVGELEAAEPWYVEALRMARELDDSWSILDNTNCLADGYLGLGQIARAEALFAEGLCLALHLGAKGWLAWFVGGFYSLAKRQGDGTRAARLGAFSESILRPSSQYSPRFAEALGLDERLAAAEWEAGRNMTLEQAASYALGTD